MKTTMKKVLSMALALVLVLGMLPMAAMATTLPHAHDLTKDTCGIDGCTYHKSECAAGHTFDGTYSYDANNHWQVCTKCLNWFNTNAHTGGTATCTTKKVCDTCKQPYGDVDPTAHTGGTASCKAQAVCTSCNTPYGGANSNNHIRTEIRYAKAATCNTEGHEGNRYCLDCNATISYGSVIPATGNHVDANNTWEYNDGEHYRTCGCGETFDHEGHKWEEATATTPKLCSVCGKIDSNYPALGIATISVRIINGGTTQSGGSFTVTAGDMTAKQILTAFLATSSYSESNITSYYVTDSKYTGNQNVPMTAGGTYVLTITPANNVNNNYTNNNDNVISVGFVPNYNNYNTPYVINGIAPGTPVYSINNNITRVGYTLEAWCYNRECTEIVPNNAVVNNDATFYAKWKQIAPYNVSVVVYTNGNKQTPTVTLDLYEWAQDGVITLADLQQAVVKHGIKANNNAGLSVYGPFTPNQWTSYVSHDYFRNSTERVSVNAGEATVLYAMVHNVKITKGTVDPYGAIADKSNPKTGDMIYAPMMVLGLSASALAVLFYLNKKRAF